MWRGLWWWEVLGVQSAEVVDDAMVDMSKEVRRDVKQGVIVKAVITKAAKGVPHACQSFHC